MREQKQNKILKKAIILLSERCPRLKTFCYWAGTSAIALEELAHRISFDLDFHTRKALVDVRPILAELQKAFSDRVEIIQAPDQFGSAFRCIISIAQGESVTIEVLSNFEDVPDADLVKSYIVHDMHRISLSRYLADKVQCIAERAEARDLVDIQAVIKKHPHLKNKLKDILSQHDSILITERLLSWTDKGIEEDLASYHDVQPSDAIKMRILLLEIIKQIEMESK